jgi:hypothetical protein
MEVRRMLNLEVETTSQKIFGESSSAYSKIQLKQRLTSMWVSEGIASLLKRRAHFDKDAFELGYRTIKETENSLSISCEELGYHVEVSIPIEASSTGTKELIITVTYSENVAKEIIQITNFEKTRLACFFARRLQASQSSQIYNKSWLRSSEFHLGEFGAGR